MPTATPKRTIVEDCPVRATTAVIGGKWKPLILYHLKRGPRRYGELRLRTSHVSRTGR